MNKSFLFGIIGISTFAYGAYMPIKAELAQYLIQSAWNVSNNTGYQVKPWNWMDSHPVMRLSSTQHNQDLIVLSGDTGNVLAFGPGHNTSTTHPGRSGTTLISGHRDTHFDFLQDVSMGDEFKLDSMLDNDDYTYKVNDIKIIDSDQQDISISSNQSELKLVTCYPFNTPIAGGPLRYVVTASLVSK
ncbi:MAG: class GN sortase [Gammaproteobacteria bacterium]|nr:class GN sortase [Gammaproteobacteria bacterium]